MLRDERRRRSLKVGTPPTNQDSRLAAEGLRRVRRQFGDQSGKYDVFFGLSAIPRSVAYVVRSCETVKLSTKVSNPVLSFQDSGFRNMLVAVFRTRYLSAG